MERDKSISSEVREKLVNLYYLAQSGDHSAKVFVEAIKFQKQLTFEQFKKVLTTASLERNPSKARDLLQQYKSGNAEVEFSHEPASC